MKRSKRTNLITSIIVKTRKAQIKVSRKFYNDIVSLPTSRLEYIDKNVKVKDGGKKIVVD